MGKMIDRYGRLFGKVSVIDLLVVLVVVVMAVALHVKNNQLNASNTSSQANTTITFTVLVENIYDYRAEAIRVGDKVYDKDRSSGGAIGVITAIKTMPSGMVEPFRDGTFAYLTREDTMNLLVTIQGSGSVNNGRYAINRVYELGVNAARNFCTNYSAFTGSVTQIV